MMEAVGRALRGTEESPRGLEPRDVAAILGLSRGRGPVQVWERATGSPFAFASASELDELRWKQRLEPLIVERYQEETHRIVSIRKRIFPPSDLEAPFLFADVQHLLAPEEIGVSFKILRTLRGYGSPSRPEPSPEAWAEAQVLLWMTGFSVWHVAALVAGFDLRIFQVLSDPEAQTFIIDYAADWYRRHVEGGERPETPGAGAAANAWANQAFSMRAAAPIMEADPEAESLADSYFRAVGAIELLEVVRQASARGLYNRISEGAVLRGGDWSARLDRQATTNHEALAGLCLEKLSQVGAFENGLTVQGLFDQASRFVPSKLVVERSVVDE